MMENRKEISVVALWFEKGTMKTMVTNNVDLNDSYENICLFIKSNSNNNI
jgi:hypothetical protein